MQYRLESYEGHRFRFLVSRHSVSTLSIQANGNMHCLFHPGHRRSSADRMSLRRLPASSISKTLTVYREMLLANLKNSDFNPLLVEILNVSFIFYLFFQEKLKRT